MRKEVIEKESYILEEEEKARNRDDILGTHKAPIKNPKATVDKKKSKSGRMKTFYFNQELPSWEKFLNSEISLDEMRELQKLGE